MTDKNNESISRTAEKEKTLSDNRNILRQTEESGFLPSVLYIEDNYSHILLVKRILEIIPEIHFISARTAKAGLEMALQEPPDLILLDIRMPEMDGYQIKEQLNEHPLTRNIPVIALSASAMNHEVDKAASLGLHRYITKPIRIREFLDAVNDELAAVYVKKYGHS